MACTHGGVNRMHEIDGAYGEGGGQLLRTAVALAAITGESVRLFNIRAKRANPGLAPQHLTAVKSVAALCGARVEGLEAKSSEIGFYPGPLRGGRFDFDVGTAGSITLVLQAVLPAAVACGEPVAMHLRGGTDVRASPPLDYFGHVFLPQLQRMGAQVSLRLIRRGYYPRGGGEVEVKVAPAGPLRPLCLDTPGALEAVAGVAHIANLPAHIAARMVRSATEALPQLPVPDIAEQLVAWPQAIGRGGAIALWARCANTVLGAAAAAERGLPAEQLGSDLGAALRAEITSGATLDVHAADQMLVYVALARGPSRFLARTLSSHAATTMWLLEQFLPVRFAVEKTPTVARVECRKTD